MSDKFYSVSKGQHFPHLVTEGGASSGQAIELRVSDTIYAKKMDVLLGVEALRNYLAVKETSPIA